MNATALHQTIADVEVQEPGILRDISGHTLKRRLKTRTFVNTVRYGKNLFAAIDDNYLLRLHFGMTGFLKYFKPPGPDLPHARLLIRFDNGYTLAYNCQRLLGEISLEESVEKFVHSHKLGQDALAISPDEFQKVAKATHKAVKSLLMDQNNIAGLGNVYADEILFRSGLHPKLSTRDLDDKQCRTLYQNMGKVLHDAVACQADPEQMGSSWLVPRRHDESRCPRCDAALEQIKVSGRTTYFCPRCQQ